jgi:hypothetical protein
MIPAVHDVAHLRFTLGQTGSCVTFTVTPFMSPLPKVAVTPLFSGPVSAAMADQLRALAAAIEGMTT